MAQVLFQTNNLWINRIDQCFSIYEYCRADPCFLISVRAAYAPSHTDWVPCKGSAKVNHIGMRAGLISIFPIAAIDIIHVFRFAGNNSDRCASTRRFFHTWRYPPEFQTRPWAPPRMNAEAGDHFIKDQRNLILFGHSAEFS